MVCPDAALEHLRRAASAMRGKGDPAQRAGVLTLLGITYTRAAMLPLTARMLAAIRCYQDAADLYAAARQFEPWARMQFNLGNAWCELQEAEFPGKWEQAIAHYKQALLYRRRDVNPQAYAVTLENLGSAYRARTQGNKTENVVEAIRCYRRALRICREDVAPASWAALQNNLGNALLSLPAEFWPASSRAPAAIRHFDFALRIRTREKNLYDYGVTQLNRAQAYFQLGLDGSGGDLMEAAEGFHDALEAFVASGHAAEAKIARRGLELIGQAATWVPLHNGPIPAAGGPLRRCE